MSERTLIACFVLFLFATGLYFYSQHREHAGVKSVLTRIGDESWKEADEIEVSFRGEGFRLVRRAGRWLIEDGFPRPAQEELVETLLNTLAGLYGEPRAKGKEFFARFVVDDDEALRLVLKKEGKVLATILVGKRGPNWESSFVRLAGGEEIYLVPVNLLAKLGVFAEKPAAPQWRAFVDLKVLDLRAEDLKMLALEGRWRLLRRGEGFVFQMGPEERSVTKEEVASFLRQVFPLMAEEVLPPQEFTSPRARLLYETSLGVSGKLLIGPCRTASKEKGAEEEGTCLVRRGEFVYRVKKKALDPLFNPPLAKEK